MAGGHGHEISYGGLSLHAPKRWHTLTGKAMGAVMWFWIFYRAKQDGAALLGLRHPWEAHGHAHGHGHQEGGQHLEPAKH
ncbi:hypothetical protein O6H91_21G022500 [Diphasiastrum complanatum]|uniref:Uncharacterized protein n=1 Tax=Diphasiastrum complanatum TaxID=34168 RepID=A0ACC2AIX3_DIPCM|nr:hypothetical protein O6H91_21G022500 [Diphasiastrum complanatum]